MPPEQSTDPSRQSGESEPGGKRKPDFRCYPLRGDSLAYAAQRTAPRLFQASLAAALGAGVAALLLWGLARESVGSDLLVAERAGAVAGLAALVLFGFAVAAGVPLSRWLFARGARGMAAALGFVSLGVVVLGVGAILTLVLPNGLQAAFRAAAVSAGLVPVMVAGVITTYVGRGSLPRATPVATVTAGIVGGLVLLAGKAELLDALDWYWWATIAFVAVGPVFVGAGLLRGATDKRRKELAGSSPTWSAVVTLIAWDVLLIAAYGLLAAALIVVLGEDDYVWPAIVVGALLLLGIGLVPYSAPVTRPVRSLRISGPWLNTLRSIVRAVAGLSLVICALVLLDQVGDGWPARALVAAVALTLIAAGGSFFVALALGLRHPRSVIGALIAPCALVPWFWAVPGYYVLAGIGVTLVITFLAGLVLRRGHLNADRAAAYAARHLSSSLLKPVRPEARKFDVDLPTSASEVKLAGFMFPFHEGKPRNGKGPVGKLADGAANAMAQLSDTDEPPFFKSFLRLDVCSEGAGRKLRIRCFGVTGYCEEEPPNAPVEDEVLIPLRVDEPAQQDPTPPQD